MPTATYTQPPMHLNALKLRAPHLFDCQPRSRSSHVPHRRSPLVPSIDTTPSETDSFDAETCAQCNTSTARISISKDGSHRSQAPVRQEETERYPARRIPTALPRSHISYSRPDGSASSHRSSSSSEALYVVIKLLQNSLAEANADKEWLWSVLEDAWADNKRICVGLEKVKAEKADVVTECEKIWDLLTHRTAEVKVLKQKLAQYEASAEAGDEEKPTTGSQ